jgi:uncharacterized Zn finger protein
MEWGYPSYVSVAQRREKALREVQRLGKKGAKLSPVKIAGRNIASTFWGKAWCDNLESYSDFSNRLPRGRSYARNGSVVDLQVESGKVTSLVSGSSLYRITINIRPLETPHWKKIKTQCGSQIGSLVELLQGRLSKSVMEIVTCRSNGLFPSPEEIEMSCSCPDWADMCKHVAATLYGVGSRLDDEPQLLFKLREVDHMELIAQAGRAAENPKRVSRRTIATNQLANIFDIELEAPSQTGSSAPPTKPVRRGGSTLLKEKRAADAGTTKPKKKVTSVAGQDSKSKREDRIGKRKERTARPTKALREASGAVSKTVVPPSPTPGKKAAKNKASQTAERKR